MKRLVFIALVLILSSSVCFASDIYFSTKGKYVEGRAVKPVNKEFISQLDTLYEKTCDSLAVNKKPFGLKVVFYETDKELDNFYGSTLPHKAFYQASENTIYASIQSMSDGMMAHEIAHALVYREVGNKANIKMQEVLAKYAEYVVLNPRAK